MTEIERKALELTHKGTYLEVNVENMSAIAEAYRNLHERHEAFRQEVSDAVVDYVGYVPLDSPAHPITRFIISKPDPLVEALKDILDEGSLHEAEEFSEELRAALAKRGLEIREKSDG